MAKTREEFYNELKKQTSGKFSDEALNRLADIYAKKNPPIPKEDAGVNYNLSVKKNVPPIPTEEGDVPPSSTKGVDVGINTGQPSSLTPDISGEEVLVYPTKDVITQKSRITPEALKKSKQTLEGAKQRIKDLPDLNVDEEIGVVKKWGEELGNLYKLNPPEKLINNLSKSQVALQKSLEDIQNFNIDPNRYLNNLSTAEKVVLSLANAFGSYNEVISYGKQANKIPDMIEKAITRDINIQKLQLNNKLKLAGFNERQVNRAIQAYESGMNNKIKLGLQSAQLVLSKAALKQKGYASKLEAANIINSIDSKIASLESKQTETQTTKTGQQFIKFGGKSGGSEFDKSLFRIYVKDFAGANQAIKETLRLENKLKNYDWFDRKTPLTENQSKILRDHLQVLAVNLRKANESGVMTEPDFQRYRQLVEGDYSTVSNRRTLLMRMHEIQNLLLSGVNAKNEVYKKAGIPTERFEPILRESFPDYDKRVNFKDKMTSGLTDKTKPDLSVTKPKINNDIQKYGGRAF